MSEKLNKIIEDLISGCQHPELSEKPDPFYVLYDPVHESYDFFFPNQDANEDRIVCWTWIGQHSEASLEYVEDLIKPDLTSDEVLKAILPDLGCLINNYGYRLQYQDPEVQKELSMLLEICQSLPDYSYKGFPAIGAVYVASDCFLILHENNVISFYYEVSEDMSFHVSMFCEIGEHYQRTYQAYFDRNGIKLDNDSTDHSPYIITKVIQGNLIDAGMIQQTQTETR